MTTPTGAPDWGGTRLLSAEQVVQAVNVATLAPGASQTYTIPVTRPSYRIRAYFQNITDAVTITPVQIDMEWDAPGLAFVTDRQRWNLFAGDNTGAHYIVGKGPCAGVQLKLTITNNAASVATLQYELFITECAQYFTYHDWRTDDFTQVKFPGYTQVASDVRAGFIAQLDHVTIPANGTVNYAIPLFSGPCTWTMNINTGTSFEIVMINGADLAFATNALEYVVLDNSTFLAPALVGTYPVPLFLPRTQAVVQFLSFDAGVDRWSMSLVAGPVP